MMGLVEIHKQGIDGNDISLHWQKDEMYLTKIFTTYGVIKEEEGHMTYCNTDGEYETFNYIEPMSQHNHSKHRVDKVNIRCYIL